MGNNMDATQKYIEMFNDLLTSLRTKENLLLTDESFRRKWIEKTEAFQKYIDSLSSEEKKEFENKAGETLAKFKFYK
jgi:hypothetical protein